MENALTINDIPAGRRAILIDSLNKIDKDNKALLDTLSAIKMEMAAFLAARKGDVL